MTSRPSSPPRLGSAAGLPASTRCGQLPPPKTSLPDRPAQAPAPLTGSLGGGHCGRRGARRRRRGSRRARRPSPVYTRDSVRPAHGPASRPRSATTSRPAHGPASRPPSAAPAASLERSSRSRPSSRLSGPCRGRRRGRPRRVTRDLSRGRTRT